MSDVDKLALTRPEAADLLSMSLERYINDNACRQGQAASRSRRATE